MENPKFSINKYFQTNYGLGSKPAVSKIQIKKFAIIVLLACLVLTFAVNFLFILATAFFGFIFIGLPLMKQNKEKAAAKEWEDKLNYCRNNWYKDYEKLLEKTITDLNAKKRGMDKLGIIEEDVGMVPPFSIRGKDYNGYYRVANNGEYRTDGHQITWLYFSETQVFVYSVKFKLTEPKKLVEETQELFYTDIVSVSINSSVQTLKASNSAEAKKEDETIDTEDFTLVVPGDKLRFAFTSNSEVNNSINGMKNLIRQKKMQK